MTDCNYCEHYKVDNNKEEGMTSVINKYDKQKGLDQWIQ